MTAAAAPLAGRVEAVLEGAGGRLFLDRSDGFDARALFEAPPDLEAAERLWGGSLARLSRLAKAVGAELVVLIAPDAHGVHPEALPTGRAYAEPAFADHVAQVARERGIAVVQGRDLLRAARGPVEVMRPTDSHWSGFGAWLAYRAVMDALPVCGPARVEADAFAYEWRVEAGDLGAGCEPPRRTRVAVPRLHAPAACTVLEAMNARRHALAVTEIGDRALPSAVMIRDSFAGEIAPFLAEGFRRLVMVGAENLLFEDLIHEERPQAIILERGERTLLHGLVDPPPFTGWREHWPQADAAPGPERPAALLRHGVDRLREGLDGQARDLFARACTLAPWSGEAYEHLGYAALRLQDFALARYALERACGVAPHRPGGWLWASALQAAQGDGEAALRTLGAGLAACPDDPSLQAAQARLAPAAPVQEPGPGTGTGAGVDFAAVAA